jgi:hypothetical protein
MCVNNEYFYLKYECRKSWFMMLSSEVTGQRQAHE